MSVQSKVGFVGLGMMGYPMAARIAAAAFELFVIDADESRTRQFVDEHKTRSLTPSDATSLDVVITMLPNSNIVEAVLVGEAGKSGLARQLSRGAVVIDMSSSEPARSRELSKLLAGMGLKYLDAPVSGGVKKALSGTLAILVGGDETVLSEQRKLLSTMGEKVLHIGPAGSGHAAKALNNYVSATGLVATVEALQVAQRFGITPEAMTDVLNASSGRTNTSETKVKQFMLSGTYGSGFALKLMTKDLNIAHALAEAMGYSMPLGDASVAIWNKAAKAASATTDHTEMYRLMADKLE